MKFSMLNKTAYLWIVMVVLAVSTGDLNAQTLEQYLFGVDVHQESAEKLVFYTMVTVLVGLILTPAAIAFKRGHIKFKSVLLLSIFFGWTGFIWAGLLFYATFSPVSGPIGRREIDLLRLEIRRLRKEDENPAQA